METNYTKLGRVRPVYKGTWSESADYTVLDVVRSADGRAAYIALKDVPAGTALTGSAYWGAVLDVSEVLDAADEAVAAAVNRADAAAASVYSAAAHPLSASETANPAQIYPDADTAIRAAVTLAPAQSGSGTPSADNVRPISGRTAVSLTRCGKNLLNYDKWKTTAVNAGTGEWTDNGVALTATGDDCYTHFKANAFPCPIAVSAGDSLTVSWEHSGADGNVDVFANGDASAGKRAKASAGSLTYTVPDGAAFITIRVGVTGTGNVAIYKNVMVELGSAATAFEPFSGDAFTLDLGDTVYSGSIDWSRGELVVDKKGYAFTGEEAWTASKVSDGTYKYRVVDLISDYVPPALTSSAPDVICSHYEAKSADNVYSSVNGISLARTGATVDIYDSSYNTNDVSLWKAYLAGQYSAGTPVQMVYTLKEPLTAALDAPPVTALEGLNTVYTDGDGLTVGYNKSIARAFDEVLARIAALESAVV